MDNNYNYTISKIAEYIDYYGVKQVVESLLQCVKNPGVIEEVSTILEDVEFREKRKHRFNEAYAEYMESL